MKPARARHVVANTLAGLFLGLGASLMLTLYGVVGWSTTTPDLVIVLGVVLGLGVGLLPVRTIRKPTTAASTSEYPSRSYQAPRA